MIPRRRMVGVDTLGACFLFVWATRWLYGRHKGKPHSRKNTA
jgi:hypothetical protein